MGWSKDEMRGNYRVQLNVAGYEFFGQADLPQTAKHNAASQAMAVVRALPDPSGVAQVVNPPPPGAPKVEPVSVPISMDGKNVNMATHPRRVLNNWNGTKQEASSQRCCRTDDGPAARGVEVEKSQGKEEAAARVRGWQSGHPW